jgi:hypothetical protein
MLRAIINGKELGITACTILATRNWYADNAQGCIDEALSGEVRVNDLDTYIEWRKSNIVASLIGLSDHTVAFLQMAVYIQTGESAPLLN